MSFAKMYLVTEEEFNKLKKPSKIAQDAQVLTNSLKAVVQKRKKQGFVDRIKLRKYMVDGGVPAMTDKDVINPPRRGRQQQHSTPVRHHRQHAPQRSSIFSTPAAETSMLRHYAV